MDLTRRSSTCRVDRRHLPGILSRTSAAPRSSWFSGMSTSYSSYRTSRGTARPKRRDSCSAAAEPTTEHRQRSSTDSVALQQPLLRGLVRLARERCRDGTQQVRVLDESEILVTPDLLVAGVADEEEQSTDVELRGDPQLDAGDLRHPHLPGGPDRPPSAEPGRVSPSRSRCCAAQCRPARRSRHRQDRPFSVRSIRITRRSVAASTVAGTSASRQGRPHLRVLICSDLGPLAGCGSSE